jgi:hypothetical protein
MPVTQERFLQVYGNVLMRTWEDVALKRRFLENPAEVLREFGLDAGSASIKVIEPWQAADPAQCTPESAVMLWNKGLESGEITFVYPSQLPEGAAGVQLSVAQMEAISGGCGCCCTPCCCCGDTPIDAS